jgi:hypothetical protein
MVEVAISIIYMDLFLTKNTKHDIK